MEQSERQWEEQSWKTPLEMILPLEKFYTYDVAEKFILSKNANGMTNLPLHVLIGLCLEQEVNVF